MSEWISVYDDLPNDKVMVVALAVGVGSKSNYTTDPYCIWMQQGEWCSRWPHDDYPTHWMPLPEPPTT